VASSTSFRTVDGREIRFAGVLGPGEDGQGQNLADITSARGALARSLSQRKLTLALLGKPDRYSRPVAEVFSDGVWVQEAMVRQGLLRVAPDAASAPCLPALLAAEQQAMDVGAGLWSGGRYRIRTPDQLTQSAGRFEIIQGEVWRTRLSNGRITIEFVSASNFKVTVTSAVARALRQQQIDLRRLRGQTLRVRGWIGVEQSPAMAPSLPGAFQLIGKIRGRART
jgi:hypothetical protein